jgi:predicted  nucleic acid-binding Zn-ribbon protein
MDWPMAQRDTTRKTRASRRAQTEAASAKGESLTDRLESLEHERERLVGELDSARQRIAELERLNDLAVNRIDWVLDSLHNLVEQES